MTRNSKDKGLVVKAFATVFTAVIAPVLVSVSVQGLNAVVVNVPPSPRASAACLSRVSGTRDIFVCCGCGATLAEARRDALRSALLQAVSVALNGSSSEEKVTAVCEDILREPGAIVLRCDDLPRQREGGISNSSYRREVVVELARQPLLDRLRADHLQLKDG